MTSNRDVARILVTDTGRGSAISIIRSLGRSGYEVVAADSNDQSLGFRSRYASDTLLYPDPRSEPDRFCDCLLNAVREKGIDLVVPVTDWVIQPLARVREAFAPHTRLALADNVALTQVINKERTRQLAAGLGVPVPETRPVRSVGEALEAAPRLGWPVVLKPQSSYQLGNGRETESFGVVYADSAIDLERKMTRFEGHCTVLLQEYHCGAGFGVEMLASRGRVLAAFQHRRLHEMPVTGGASTYRESCALDPQLYEFSARLLAALEWTGLAMVEYKVGEGGPVLMEINGRVWGSLPLAIKSGMDFPRHLVRLLFEGESAFGHTPLRDYKLGVRSRDLLRDLTWISAILAQHGRYPFLPIPRRRAAFTALLSLLDPRRKTDLGDWDDPLPALLQVPRIVPHLLKKARSVRAEQAVG
ncbi:MAG: ATP-grasp domain-containing protein [Candidatus Latescibacterota bacterium]|nr:MAG: ATP-grasp domain-containing protein [Candidatus Latescibacterota bacterium]